MTQAMFQNQEGIAANWRAQLSDLRKQHAQAKEAGQRGLMTSISSKIKKYEGAPHRLTTTGVKE